MDQSVLLLVPCPVAESGAAVGGPLKDFQTDHNHNQLSPGRLLPLIVNVSIHCCLSKSFLPLQRQFNETFINILMRISIYMSMEISNHHRSYFHM